MEKSNTVLRSRQNFNKIKNEQKNLILATLTVSLLAMSCNKTSEKPKEEQKALI